MDFLSPERKAYYQAKKRELRRRAEANRVIQQDAIYIYYYGMSAFIELFPEVKEFGTGWHEAIVKELQKMERQRLGQQLSGHFSAVAATKDKKAFRRFKSSLRNLFK